MITLQVTLFLILYWNNLASFLFAYLLAYLVFIGVVAQDLYSFSLYGKEDKQVQISNFFYVLILLGLSLKDFCLIWQRFIHNCCKEEVAANNKSLYLFIRHDLNDTWEMSSLLTSPNVLSWFSLVFAALPTAILSGKLSFSITFLQYFFVRGTRQPRSLSFFTMNGRKG